MCLKRGKISWLVDFSWRSLSSYSKKKGIIYINVLFAINCSLWVSEKFYTAQKAKLTSITTVKSELSTSWIDPGISRSSLPLLERHIESLGEKSTGRYGHIFKFLNVKSAIYITIFPKWATAIFINNLLKSRCHLMDQWDLITSTPAARRRWTLLKF